MYKHTVKYVDFNGDERQEDLYFHLSKVEAVRLEVKYGTSIVNHMEALAANNNLKEMLECVEEIMLTAYGQKSTDGRSFQKSDAIREEFSNSIAYAEIFEDLITDKNLARKFGEQIVSDEANRKKNTVEPKVVHTDQ